MSNVIVTNLQHCVENNDDYANYTKNTFNVVALFDNVCDADDELSLAGDIENVKKCVLNFYGDDIEQAQYCCPSLF